MRTISLKVPEELDEELSRIARETRRSKSRVIREAIIRATANSRTLGRRSFLDRARDLAGCVEAEADLSFDKRHLSGYGR